ncbi:hypothetical protein HK102_002907 [Quaeritorhiza haematococci]|nr:hypothetical protein HK102_002907 [Quaeritorhiza haematococci]
MATLTHFLTAFLVILLTVLTDAKPLHNELPAVLSTRLRTRNSASSSRLHPRDANTPALKLTLTQSLFDEITPMLTRLVAEQVEEVEADELDLVVPVPVVGDVTFRASAGRISNITVDAAKALLVCEDGKMQFDYSSLKFGLAVDVSLLYGKKERASASVVVNADMGVTGDVLVKNNGRGAVRTSMTNVKAAFATFDIKITNSVANWVVELVNKIFGGIVKKALGTVVAMGTKVIVPGLVNVLFQNQLSLGIGLDDFSAKVSPVVIGDPVVSKARGVEVAVGLKVDQTTTPQ